VLIGLIVAGEIGFWALLGTGLAARYLLRRRRLSNVLLLGVPLVDLVLLVASTVDLRRGATPGMEHGLAAAYLGFTVAFGRATIRWADERFAYRFADGPRPWKPPRYGAARIAYEWRSFGLAVLGWAVAAGLLGAGYLLVGGGERGQPLLDWIGRLAVPLAFWLIFGPVWESLFPTARPGKGAKRPRPRG
jgi:hypothetical protein